MSRWRRMLAGVLTVVLVAGLAPAAMADTGPAKPEAAGPGGDWKPESDRNWWDRLKGRVFGEDKPESREIAAAGVPREDPAPARTKAPPARRVKELPGRRTANTKTYQLADGRLQQELSAVPLHYRGKDGGWHDIDATVRPSDRKGVAFANETNSFRSYFGTSPGELVSFDADGARLTLGVPQSKPEKPQAKDGTVTYKGLLDGADLSYEIARDALKEKIVLAAPPANGAYTFTLRPEGVRAWQRPDGSIAFFKGDFDGRAVFVLPKPFMYDSAPDASSPYGRATSSKVSQSMRWDGASGLLHITVRADNAWLKDAKRKYPVVIDPTIKIAPTPTKSQDTMISSDGPDQNYDDNWRLSVGTTGTGRARALLRFPLGEIPTGTQIDSAQLQMYYDQHHTTNATSVQLGAYRATAAWDETTATWNNAGNIVGELSGNSEQVDDGDAGKTSMAGSWPYSTNQTIIANAINRDYAYNNDAATGHTYTWTPRVTEAGSYRVDVHYVEAADRATNAPYTVTYNGGSRAYTVNQYHATETKGVWTTLDTHPFAAGTAGRITLGDVSGKAVIADAVRLVKTGTVTRAAGDKGSHWHSFPVRDTVQQWVNGAANHGFVVKAVNEATLGQGGPRYEGSLFFYNGETATYPKLVVTHGRPGVEVNSPATIHATGAEVTWPAYTDPSSSPDDDIVEYQVHRSVWQTFTPSQATLVAPVPDGTTRYTDTTAQPTPAGDPDPFGNSYYYMVAVKTRDGTITPGPTQLARLPKAGRVTRIYQSGVTDTTLTASLPDANQDVLAGEPWLMAGNNSGTYGRSRALLKFPALTDIPATAQVLDAQVKLWTAGVDPGGAGTYELRGLTRDFSETTATWNRANSTTPWTTPGGDYSATVAGTGSGWSNDPQQRNLTATTLAQQWVADPSSDHGAIVKLANEAGAGERAIFVSSETEEPQLRPQLVVTYLETTPENTYYVPATPGSVPADSTQGVEVTLTNTTTSAWAAADWVLSYRWTRPDGTPVTVQQLHTALPRDMPPGDTATVSAQVKAPPVSIEGNKRVDHVLEWDLWNRTTGTWLSEAPEGAQAAAAVNRVGALKQSLAVEESTSDQVGLEKFYAYAGKNTGAGSTVMNNLHAGNAVWSYNAFTNPSRGLATFLRLAYNSKDTSDTVAGYGWSLQASSLMRLGTPIDPHPNTQGRTVSLTDGDGTTHTFTLDDKGNTDPSDDEYTAPAGVHYYLQRLAECGPQTENARAWTMTRPDRTQFYFDCQGYLSSIEDNNGNRMDFTYEVRNSNNKPTKFLRYITDPAGRQTLTIDYYTKGEDYSYIDDTTWEKRTGTGLTNPHIIDHVKSITDISGRRLTLTYSDKGLLGELADGAGSAQPKVFGFQYDATQGNKNVKLVKATDPRGNATELAYYDTPEDDPKFKWSLKSIKDRLGYTTSFAYTDPDGTAGQQVQTVVTDAENHSTTYLMDGKGRPLQTTNARNQTTKLTWDADNNVTHLEEPPASLGATPAVSTWVYDPKTGYPTEIKDAEAVANGWAGTALTYQTGLNGHIADLIGKRSPEGRQWTFTHTTEGDLASVTDPAGNATTTEGDYTTRYTYDTWGQLETAKDANGNTTTNSDFAPVGYPRAITDALDKTARFVYDDRGQVTKVTDPLLHDTTQTYDTYGRPGENRVPKDQAAGDFITTPAPDYDPNDNVVSATAPNGAVTTAAYDAADQVTDTLAPKDDPTDPERRTTITYDKVGNLKTQTAPKGNLSPEEDDYTVTSTYDEIYQLVEAVNSRGEKITSSYDDAGNLVKVVDPKKNLTADPSDYTSRSTYDLNHHPKTQIDALGKTTSTNYDRDGLPVETIDQENNKTTTRYDARGLPFEVQVPHRSDNGEIVHNTTRYEYDQVGNQTKTITPRGVATAAADDFTYQTVYDELNRVKEQLSAYDPADSRYNAPDRTIFEYDAAGRMTKVSAPPSHGQTVRNDTLYTYLDNGWTESATDPWDILTRYDYNELGQQTSNTLTSAGGSSSRTMIWDYYPSGNLKARRDSGIPVGAQSVLVDNSDYNNTAETPSGGWTANTAENQYGYNIHTRPAGNGTGLFVWQLTIPQDGDYEVFVRHPDTANAAPDARFTVTHSGGDTTRTIDQRANSGEWVSLGTYSFTENGLHKITLSDQATSGTTVTADTVKLVRNHSGDADDERKDFTYRYDPSNNLIEVGDNSPGATIGTYANTYDDLDRIAQVQERNGATVVNTTGYTYDPNGNPITRTHDTTWSKFDYNPLDLVETITNAASESAAEKRISSFTYTPRQQLATQTKPNGNTVTFDYTLDGAIARQSETKSGGGTVAEHTLTYTPNGDIANDVAKLQNADNPAALLETTYDYTYDPQDRLATLTKTGHSAGTESYVHDANHNVITQTVAGTTTNHNYDRNRLLTSSANGITSTYNYDPLGRLDTVSTGGQVSERYRYDGFDRTKSHTAGTGAAAKTTTYTYDPFDRTTSTTTGGKRTDFAYLGTSGDVLTERVDGQLTKSYEYSAWGSKLTQIKHNTSGREISQYTYHPRGDVEAITKDNGDTRATYGYSAYGEDDTPKFTGVDKPDPETPDAEPYNAYRFNGHRYDQGSGTYDMGFRNYDPGLNRFLTRDVYGGALDDMGLATDPFTGNRYAFAGGNPITFAELNGHDFLSNLGNFAAGASESLAGATALLTPLAPVEIAGWAGVGPGISGMQRGISEDAGADTDSGAYSAGYWTVEAAMAAADGAGLVKAGGRALARGGAGLAKGILGAVRRGADDAAAGGARGADNAKSAPGAGGAKAAPQKPRRVQGPAGPKKAPRTKSPGGPTCPIKPPNSFVPGTTVLMADGSHKAIEDIQTGDHVIATDPETGDTRAREVEDTITGEGRKHLVTITVDLDGEHGDQTANIVATDEHPFWLPDHGRWANAEDLKPGMWLRASTGAWIQITAIESQTRWQRVHNLIVADVHTYYVLPGQTPVLVHNINTPRGCGPNGEPIYDIPAGSSGGPGAGQRIPAGMLGDYNIGVNADPSLPTPLCSYCRMNPAQALDHIIARIRGGDLSDANVTPACRHCNSSKRDHGAPLNPPAGYTGPWPPPHWPPHIRR